MKYGIMVVEKSLAIKDIRFFWLSILVNMYAIAKTKSDRAQCEPSMTFWAIYTVLSFSVIYTALCYRR